MSTEVPYSRGQITCFVDLLKNELPEHRGNRGKRHPLALVIAAFVLATLVGHQKLPNIHHLMRNCADWVSATSRDDFVSRALARRNSQCQAKA